MSYTFLKHVTRFGGFETLPIKKKERDTGQWPCKLKYINHAGIGDQDMQYTEPITMFFNILIF